MKLTVLGKYGPFPAPGGACSGYLVESGDVRLVLDMGSGTLSRLFRKGGLAGIDAVLLSHLHSDHTSDLFVLRYALEQLTKKGYSGIPCPLTIACPTEPEAEWNALSSIDVYNLQPIQDGTELQFGRICVKFRKMRHPIPSYSMEISDGEKSLFYTGDSGFFDGVEEFCKDADLLLADCGLLSSEKPTVSAPHFSGREAGEIAAKAGVKALLCSHINGICREELVLNEAQSAFKKAEIAEELRTYEL